MNHPTRQSIDRTSGVFRHVMVAIGLAWGGASWACDEPGHLDVVTFNAWGLPAPLAPDRKGRLARAAAWLDTLDTDVVALQEVWDGAVPLLPMALRRSGRGGDDGLGLSGRLADGDVDVLRFSHGRGFDALKRKGALRTRVHVVDVGEVWIVVTHLQSGRGRANAGVREAQLDELLAWTEDLDGPLVLLGDLNVDARHDEDLGFFDRLARGGFVDVAEQVGAVDATYPGDGRRYDRILARGGRGWGFEAEHVVVVHYDEDPQTFAPSRLSDHRPVRARLHLVRRATASTGRDVPTEG